MDSHTLTEEQGKELSGVLETHISKGMPVGEAGPTLLVKLQRLSPNQGQKYAVLFLNPGEEEIFQALINSHWPKQKETNDTSNP